MFKIKVHIPWWYKPFIKFMPGFYNSVPSFKTGKFKVAVFTQSRLDLIQGTATYKLSRKTYSNTHQAYLASRWKAFWFSFWDATDRQVSWLIKKEN